MKKKLKILHLEDDPADVELVRSMLEKENIDGDIIHVQTKEGFCDALKTGAIELILADYRLPTYDGMQALDFVLANYPTIPFVFVSGTMGEEAAIDALTKAEGTADYVLKANLSRLRIAIKRTTDNSRNILERKKAEELLYRKNRELQAISNCNQVLMRAVEEEKLLQDICSIICNEAGYRFVWVGFAEHDEFCTVKPVAWAGIEEEYLEKARISWADNEYGRGPTGVAIRTGRSQVIQDFNTDPKATPWRENALKRGFHSSVALPLMDELSQVFGVLNIYSGEVNAFSAEELRLLEELAGDLAFGLTTLRTRAEREIAEKELEEKNRQLSESLKAKEVLLQELYHRTKNTLQIILSMINLQAKKSPDNTDFSKLVSTLKLRIQSISLVHQMLFQAKNLSCVSIKEYIERLTQLIITGFAEMEFRVTLDLSIDDIYMLFDTIIPLGLIINELMTNSLKYAFPDNRKGSISISLKKSSKGMVSFLYTDDGVGLPVDFDYTNLNSLGCFIINSLGKDQLQGCIKIGNDNGFFCSIEFPETLYEARV